MQDEQMEFIVGWGKMRRFLCLDIDKSFIFFMESRNCY